MSRGWGIPEQHLLPDAVVAFVDGELSAGAHDRAAAHLARCPLCAAEATAQRQARDAVRAAEVPGASAGLLAALRSIPIDVEPPTIPDHLAMSPDGQLVMIQRPERAAALGMGPVIGSSTPLGAGNAVLSTRPAYGRRAVQGAGVVAAGLVLGAMAVVGSHVFGGLNPVGPDTAGTGSTAATEGSLLQANFGPATAVPATSQVITPTPARTSTVLPTTTAPRTTVPTTVTLPASR
ncbi:MAG TPA: zf-HC2 domain-containing protein [Pseudonocardiaceae bacterium]